MNKQNMLTRLAGVAGAGLIVSQSLLPVFAGSLNISVSGNGADANNDVKIDYKTQTVVSQSNNVEVKNDINQDANTGENKIEKNTGSDINVKTGDVTQSASASTAAGMNSAELDNCGACELNLGVAIEKNGADSKNEVDFDLETSKQLFQENNVEVKNDVDQDADTGDNDIEENTGGDIGLETGDVDQSVSLHTEAGANVASMGGNGGGIDLDLSIMENGADSDNEIDLDIESDTVAVQDNSVEVENDVDQDADTGDNDIEENTSGDVDVVTGDVEQDVEVWNAIGYNALDLDGCCELDGDVMVDKNGADSENDVKLDIEFLTEFFQSCGDEGYGLLDFWKGWSNDCEVDNDIDQDADTGENDVEKNTGDDLTTGDVEQSSSVTNEAGANVIGDGADVEVEVSFSMLLSLLQAIFG